MSEPSVSGPCCRDESSIGAQRLRAGIESFAQGDLEPALVHLEAAIEWGRSRGDEELADRALCNRSAIELELGRPVAVAELQRALMRSRDPETAYLAAYNSARAYELNKEHGHALRYARIALDRSLKTGRRDWLAFSQNLVANILLAESDFDEACSSYEIALKLMDLEPSVSRALILDNLGYCRFVQGRYRDGFEHLFECMRTLIRHRSERYQARPRLSLCYGYLEIGRMRSALRHGHRALEQAEHFGDDDSIKNAHFLLGETRSQLGHEEQARKHFQYLQRRYYPDAPHIPDLLLAIDVRQLVNLKA